MPHPRGQLLADKNGVRKSLLNIHAAQRMLQAAGLSLKRPIGKRSKPQDRVLGREGTRTSHGTLMRGKDARSDERVDEGAKGFADHENTDVAPSRDIDDDVTEKRVGEGVTREDDDGALSLDMDTDVEERTLSEFSTKDNDNDASSLGIEDVPSDYRRDFIVREKLAMGDEDDALSLDVADDDALSLDVDEDDALSMDVDEDALYVDIDESEIQEDDDILSIYMDEE
eukprot:GEMP01050863.1.p1 GENE.GEMP01050863.1~~GEMP01050863.1.p1  ORF type:complete len:227 (+),score=69.69 GEMP01050863.1:80-760(+)